MRAGPSFPERRRGRPRGVGLAEVGALACLLLTVLFGRDAAAGERRIVSIGGAVTEILFALGRGDEVVAVDSTSFYPAQARRKPNVGYMRQLSAEGVLGLAPSLVIASSESGPKSTIDILAAAAVPLVLVPERYTGAGVVDKVRRIAEAVGSGRRGDCLAGKVEANLAAMARLRERIGTRRRVMFVLSLMNGRPMVSGTDTAAAGIIALAGADNAIRDYRGYKLVNDEAVIAAAPDVVLVMQREGAAMTAADVFAHPAFALTPAAKTGAFVSMESLYLLGFGPRTAEAARDLAAELYPQVAERTAGADWKPVDADGGCR